MTIDTVICQMWNCNKIATHIHVRPMHNTANLLCYDHASRNLRGRGKILSLEAFYDAVDREASVTFNGVA